jgi:membrane protease YdiL (CAAX protease family)
MRPLTTFRVEQLSPRNRLFALLELAIVGLLFAVDRPGLHVIVLSKTLDLAILAAVSLQLRHRWRDVGFAAPRGARLLVLIAAGVGAGIAMEGLELFATQPILTRVLGSAPDLSDFAAVRGDLGLLGLALLGSWTLAAFGEEFVYRGYLMNRLAGLIAAMGATRAATPAALVVSSVIFGLAHLYQNLTGVTENMIDGLLLGAIYLASGRRLIVPIIAHGVEDSADSLLIYAGWYPGM